MVPPTPVASRPLRWFYISLGSVAMALGFLGIFIRGLLPTVPFLLLAAWAYAKGSPRMYDWLIHHPRLGPILQHWWAERTIPRRAKFFGIVSVWLGIGITVVFFVDHIVLRLMLVSIAIGVSVFLFTLKTWALPQEPDGPAAADPLTQRH